VKSWFPDLSTAERSALVQRLIREGYVAESDKQITFVLARFGDGHLRRSPRFSSRYTR
jgi:hypothetical protein